MTILLVLIPLGLMLLVVAILAFVWAVRNDQFEDLESEGARILFDDPEPLRERPLARAVVGPSPAASPVVASPPGRSSGGEREERS